MRRSRTDADARLHPALRATFSRWEKENVAYLFSTHLGFGSGDDECYSGDADDRA